MQSRQDLSGDPPDVILVSLVFTTIKGNKKNLATCNYLIILGLHGILRCMSHFIQIDQIYLHWKTQRKERKAGMYL